MANIIVGGSDDPETTAERGVIELSIDDGYTNEIKYDSDPFDIDLEKVRGLGGLNLSQSRKIGRELRKVHEGDGGAHSKKTEQNAYTNAYNFFGLVHPPYNQEYLSKIYELSPPHYAAVNAKVANIVGLGYDFVDSHQTKQKLASFDDKKRRDAARKKLERHKSEMYQWLDSCNKDDEFTETMIKVWTDYEVTGNGYIEIGRTVTGEIGYIGHIPAKSMRIREARDGFIQLIGKNVVFFRNFGDRDTDNPVGNDSDPNEIIHLKNYSPTHGYYGVPDIMSATQALAGNEFASRYNLDYFENKAVPRYVVVVKGGDLSKGSINRLTEFMQGTKGTNHRTIVVPLPADTDKSKVSFDMKPIEAGVQDSSFNNYRKGNLNDILMAHRVPISKIGLAEGVSLAVARDSDKTFKEQVCRPLQRILEKKINQIISEKTDALMLKLNELSLTDEDTQSKIDERNLRYGVITPNEIRRRWGWEPLEDGDKTYVQTSQEAAEQKAQATMSRTRDQNRSAQGTDSNGEGRNAQGDGRATP